MGWQKYSHEQFGLPAWGASGPYKKVYELFGLTGAGKLPPIDYINDRVLTNILSPRCHRQEGRRLLQKEGRARRVATRQGSLSTSRLALGFSWG